MRKKWGENWQITEWNGIKIRRGKPHPIPSPDCRSARRFAHRFFFAFFANCGAWSLAIFTFTSVSVNFCVESVYVRSSIIIARKKEQKQTRLTRLSFPSQLLKEQFYKINMARYRVSQKFVPLISCTIIFDQNLFLHEISRRCLFLYREHMLRISVTDMPFLFCFVFFFITFCSRCGMVWDTACRLTDDPFWAFLSPVA